MIRTNQFLEKPAIICKYHALLHAPAKADRCLTANMISSVYIRCKLFDRICIIHHYARSSLWSARRKGFLLLAETFRMTFWCNYLPVCSVELTWMASEQSLRTHSLLGGLIATHGWPKVNGERPISRLILRCHKNNAYVRNGRFLIELAVFCHHVGEKHRKNTAAGVTRWFFGARIFF